MARVIYSAAASLDGYLAGPGGDMSWLAEHAGDENPAAERLLAGVGALLVGRRTYDGDDPNRGTDAEGAFGGRYDGPVVLLTHRPPAAAPPGITVATDLAEAVVAARGLAGDGYVNVLGADVAAQCLAAGELDEVLVLVVPVLLGDGTRLFPRRPGAPRVRLEPMADDTPHWYRVVR
ncbi:dihydrofolate reductase family protein [Actinomycetospora endophytica]|uniref:Dihydrofolate reductase family protein n=1 Tax=Actinomycetospora endophytica TaxID=2291215 RepID=A0ABS8P7Z6_9PSEU|nr:dihydrofolate reductase family protein [Actinomycetospora endophytica]MCD2194365.1 dihydrofolate reductase family protein [Actinomycetospora endophytica]